MVSLNDIFVSLVDYVACSGYPCKNGGTCTPNNRGDRGFICDCPVGFMGGTCEDSK